MRIPDVEDPRDEPEITEGIPWKGTF